ncbi:hypothetical protein OGAPHI_005459 [Ogataea philodendri]|uniref:Clathrin/coatomer adaptor adaptin-like N-terminal domain-containing protein n=1 Tax=Ogataea philodendri TaxID=1378263 RepID=A0A9P8T1Z9_9ASCO|nr:uncharacterized protein OGAPHI_005459 [Ogataea philodendri]KAH3662211.1 hypothetical protein OGAPHI_005459 [Ogataea philodendri]
MAELGKNISVLLENATKNLSTTVNEAINHKNVKLPPALNLFLSNGFSHNQELSSSQIVEGLNSSISREIYVSLEYLARLMTHQNADSEVVQFFPHVIKNITSPDLKVKRLVYTILLRYNHVQQDIALLSINAIQKSLTDKNCINRALAIRTLSGIRIPAILPILILSMKKTVSDSSPLVRSATAIAITKCFLLDDSLNKNRDLSAALTDESSIPAQLYQLLETLLSDTDPKVLSSALGTFYTIFPGYMDLIHPRFTHLVSRLNFLEDSAKTVLIDLATDYSKLYLPQPTESSLCVELVLLDSKLKPFIYSSSANVVLSMIRFYYNVLPFKLNEIPLSKVLIKFLGNDESSIYILSEILYLLDRGVLSFTGSQLTNFLPLPNEIQKVSDLKLSILVRLINPQTFDMIFDELVFLVDTSNRFLKLTVIKLLNQLHATTPEQHQKIGQLFLNKLGSEKDELLVAEYVTGLRMIVQTDLQHNIDILIKLTGKLVNDSDLSSLAKASIIWLIGEFSYSQFDEPKCIAFHDYLPDLMRILVQSFRDEEYLVKLEILTALTKIISKEMYTSKQQGETYNFDNMVWKMFNLVLQFTKYDTSLDLKDRSRLIGSLLPNVVYTDPDVNANTALDFRAYYNEKSHIIEQCYEKLNEVDFSVLLFHTSKYSPVSSATIDEDNSISTYNKVTPDKLNPELLEYYNELRAQEFQLKDYGHFKSVSQSSVRQPVVVNSPVPVTAETKSAAKKYKLQTLDDFLKEKGKSGVFGGSDDEQSEDESDEESENASQI